MGPNVEPTCICDHELTMHNFDAGGSWCEKVVRVNGDGEHEWCSCWRFHDVNDSDPQDNRGEWLGYGFDLTPEEQAKMDGIDQRVYELRSFDAD